MTFIRLHVVRPTQKSGKNKDFISKIDDLFKRFFVSILLTQSFKNQCGNISTDVFTDSILNMF